MIWQSGGHSQEDLIEDSSNAGPDNGAASMKRSNCPSLGRISSGRVGDHLVKIARLGCVDHITGQVGTATEVYGENKLHVCCLRPSSGDWYPW